MPPSSGRPSCLLHSKRQNTAACEKALRCRAVSVAFRQVVEMRGTAGQRRGGAPRCERSAPPLDESSTTNPGLSQQSPSLATRPLSLLQVFEASFQLLHHLRHGSVLHLVQGQPVGLERPMTAHVLPGQVRLATSLIEAGVVEHVPRPDE